jgi:hypothetical protein
MQGPKANKKKLCGIYQHTTVAAHPVDIPSSMEANVMHGVKLKYCFVVDLSSIFCNQPNLSQLAYHGECGQPPFELLVPHEGPARSCFRYIFRGNCKTPSPGTASMPGDDDNASPSTRNDRAAPPGTAKQSAMTRMSITGTAAIPLAMPYVCSSANK